MKYLRLATDIARMAIAIPLYLVAMAIGGVADIIKYTADKIDVPEA